MNSRETAHRETIRQALREVAGLISAQQLHQRLEDHGTRISLSTVYRQLRSLADAGQTDAIPVGGEQHYRHRESGAHRHHLVCERCGRAVEIDTPSEEWIQTAAAQHGYVITHHLVEVFGLCPDCAP